MPTPPAVSFCTLAAEYYRPGNSKSFVTLLRDAWAACGRAAASAGSLAEVFATRPDLVDAWLRYSEDQRTADSWYLVTRRDEDGNERWIVGNPSTGDELQYQDAATAGAAFVSRVLGTPYVLPDDQ